MLEMAEKVKANELRQIAEERCRQKVEDQKAKQRILDQIKADRVCFLDAHTYMSLMEETVFLVWRDPISSCSLHCRH